MHNVLLAGVGGQGLVLITKIITHAAMHAGFAVKSNDVIGLSQRGGMVWGSVRFGAEVHSPNIKPGDADILLALEPLEALRFSHMVKPSGHILTAIKKMVTTSTQQQTATYPDERIEALLARPNVIALDAFSLAKELGKKEAANVILLGVVSKMVPIPEAAWEKSLAECMRADLLDLNIRAFQLGRSQ